MFLAEDGVNREKPRKQNKIYEKQNKIYEKQNIVDNVLPPTIYKLIRSPTVTYQVSR